MINPKLSEFWETKLNPITGLPDSKCRPARQIDATAKITPIDGHCYKNLQV